MFKSAGQHRKRATIGLAAVVGVAGIAAAAIAFSTGDSNAAEDCGGLDTELTSYLTGLRPRLRTGILSTSADGARREA